MPNKTISIPDRDMPLWERGEQAVKTQRLGSMSALVLNALSAYLGEEALETIIVTMYGGDNGECAVQFTGRWLVEPPPDAPTLGDPDREPGEDDPGYGHKGRPEEWRVGIAETARGRVAIYLRHWDGMAGTELHDFDSIEQARVELGRDARIPHETWEQARELLRGGHTVVWRDI